jgi:hypothetical protein
MTHTHYTGLLPVFSADDLAAIYDLLKTGYIADVEQFYSAVVTDAGTIYALTISDPALLMAYGNLYFNKGEMGFIGYKVAFVKGKFGLNEKRLPLDYENRFAQLLEGTGLSLLKGNPEDLSSWKALKLMSGQTEEINCN